MLTGTDARTLDPIPARCPETPDSKGHSFHDSCLPFKHTHPAGELWPGRRLPTSKVGTPTVLVHHRAKAVQLYARESSLTLESQSVGKLGKIFGRQVEDQTIGYFRLVDNLSTRATAASTTAVALLFSPAIHDRFSCVHSNRSIFSHLPLRLQQDHSFRIRNRLSS